jgi:lipopolysaccharide export system protein LptA
MRRLAAASSLLGLILLGDLSRPALSSPRTVQIEADLIDVDFDNPRAHAVGRARLCYGDIELEADQLTADRVSGRIDASGGVTIIQAGRALHGESLEYDLDSEEGALSDARALVDGLAIRGKRITFSPRTVEAHEASVTTCNQPDPHYSFGANRISLAADEPPRGRRPSSARLTLDRTRVTYRGRRLFTLPRYTVRVSEIGEPASTPLPITGFSRDDGPYAEVAYAFYDGGEGTSADFGYRYTTFRGVRGHLRARRRVGPAELLAQYVRREDAVDRELRIEDLEASLADVLVDRAPEYGLRLPYLEIGSSLHLRAEWLHGSYSERMESGGSTRFSADRSSISAILSVEPYIPMRGVTLSHALGWRRSDYSPGDQFRIRLLNHTAGVEISPRLHIEVSHITRRGSGGTPFLFDGLGPERELLSEFTWRATPGWRLHFVNLYDLDERATRDMILEVTRVAHCIEYTAGWRKKRGSFYIGLDLADLSEWRE